MEPDIRFPKQQCPFCRYQMECGTSIATAREADGALSICICIDCAGISIFDGRYRMRRPTAEESKEIKTSKEWPIIEHAQLLIISERRNKKRHAS